MTPSPGVPTIVAGWPMHSGTGTGSSVCADATGTADAAAMTASVPMSFLLNMSAPFRGWDTCQREGPRGGRRGWSVRSARRPARRVKTTSSTPPIVNARHEPDRQRGVHPGGHGALELALAERAEHEHADRERRVAAAEHDVRPRRDAEQLGGETPDRERAGGRGQRGPPPRQPGALGRHRGALPDVDRHVWLRLGLGHAAESTGASEAAPDLLAPDRRRASAAARSCAAAGWKRRGFGGGLRGDWRVRDMGVLL